MKQPIGLILLLAAATQAAQITFRVVAPGAKSVQVSVGGQNAPLTAADPNVPYFTGTAEAADGAKYKYIADTFTEPFDRTLAAGSTKTLNEYLNRTVTYADIPELPWPIAEEPQWTRSVPKAKYSLFDTNYIPTVFVNGDKAALDALIAKPIKDKYQVTLTVILADEVKTFKDTTFGIHGAGKKKNNAKQSWNWAFSSGQTLEARDFFKLRHMEEDPTQIREKLWADVSRAMGTYANEANMIRMFINGDGMGTFNLLDDIKEYSYISAFFYAGKPPAQMGALFDGGTGADFAYDPTPEGLHYYNWVPNSNSPEQPPALAPVCKLWSEADKTNDAAIAEVDKQLTLDMFIRFMVLEYLTGSWDGYWGPYQTNNGLYRDPTQNNRWFYLAQDFDGTFGINVPNITIAEWSYKRYITEYPGAILINGLLQNPNYQKKFETYLTKTVEVLFNNVTLSNRIKKYHEFLYPDLVWDRSIVQRSPGINFEWSLEDVTTNLNQGIMGKGATGGGAAFGLYEWISKKQDAVVKEFGIQVTATPVGPPKSGLLPPGSVNNDNGTKGGNNAGGNNNNEKNETTNVPNPKDNGKSAAGHALPQVVATAALIGASVLALVAF